MNRFWKAVDWLVRGAQRYEPIPEPGTAWCVRCSLSGGRTAVMTGSEMPAHLTAHKAALKLAGAANIRVMMTQEKS